MPAGRFSFKAKGKDASREGTPLDLSLLLPFPVLKANTAARRQRPVPKPFTHPMTRVERVYLLMLRRENGLQLWNPAENDYIRPDEMSKEGFQSEPNTGDGHRVEPTRTTTMEHMAQIVAEQRRQELEEAAKKRATKKRREAA